MDTEHLQPTTSRRHNMYKLREERNIKPTTFGHMVSSMLYEKRFGPYFTAPVIAGLEEDGTPYLCGMDSIGAMETAKDFMVQGTAPGEHPFLSHVSHAYLCHTTCVAQLGPRSVGVCIKFKAQHHR